MNFRDPVKSLIVVYLILLVTEGALRKWVFPGSANLLLVVRDPVAVLIYMAAASTRRMPKGRWMGLMLVLLFAFVALGLLQLAFGHSLPVMLFGLRTLFLHLPLIFVMAAVLTYQDVIWIGRWAMIITPFMTYLMIRQFQSPSDDLLNVGTGGTIGAQILTSHGRVRPAGSFAFVSGPVLFYPIVTAFVLYGFIRRPRSYPAWLLWVGAAAVVAVLPVSGSRSLVLGCALVLLFAMSAGLWNSSTVSGLARVLGIVVFLLYFFSFLGFFEEGKDALAARFEESNTAAGGWQNSILGRITGLVLSPLARLFEAELFGAGLGLGTNAGAAFMAARGGFVLGEGDLERIIMEAGPILGLAFVLFRVAITFEMGFAALRNVREGRLLAWLLFGATAINTAVGQMGPATSLGFIVIGAGLCFAALSEPAASRKTVIHPWARAGAASAKSAPAPANVVDKDTA